MAELVFWGVLALISYTYVGFPLTLLVVGWLRRARGEVKKADVTPSMSVVIAAYNEEESVARRIENVLWADYPGDRLEVVLASDGSDDGTAAIASCYDASGVQVLQLSRRGKIHALDDAVRAATGEVLVFSDANTVFDRGALRAIAANFADPAVGGVVGNTGYRLREGIESSGRGESLYWSYDSWLKAMESRTGSVVSAHGGLYAIRRSLYRKPEDAAVTDDFAISTAVVAQGYRLVFEPAARAWEETAPEAAGEFRRRVRLMTRGLRGVALRRELLDPFRFGFYSLVLFTHKLLRRVLPLALPVLLLASAVALGNGWIYGVAFWGQVAFYLLAIAGWLTRGGAAGRSRLLYAPFYFCLANGAGLVALANFASGRRIDRWEPIRARVRPAAGIRSAGPTQPLRQSVLTEGAADAGLSPVRTPRPAATNGANGVRPGVTGAPQRPPAAIVIGLDCATGLQTARILAAHGVPVIGIASDPGHPCCRTRVCERLIRADTSGAELIEALQRLGAQLEQRSVLFPCTDGSVLLLSRNRDELRPWFHVSMPEPHVIELLIDKSRFYPFARAQGFRVPRTWVLREREDAEEAARGLDYPCIVKPGMKTPAWKRATSAKAFRASSAAELLALYERFSAVGTLIAQEWVRGADTAHYTCNGYFGQGAEPLVTFTSRKLRQWPPMGGEGCLSEEVRNEAVRGETVRLFSHVGHRGLGYAELKQDSSTGHYVILEPNVCRPTGRSAQAEAAGVELIYTQYCDVLGWPLPANREQSFRGVKWIHYRRDFQSGLHHWRRGELTLGEWARSWKGPKRDALFSLRDPVPFLADLGRAARKVGTRGEDSGVRADLRSGGGDAR